MKKSISLFIGCFLLLNYSWSQESSFGITAGATFGSYKIKAESISVTSKTTVGFTVGIISSIPVGQHCSFMPALNFVQKGGSQKSDNSTDKIIMNYVEVPLNFVYKTTTHTGKFFVGAGPFLGIGLSGKEKLEENGIKTTTNMKFGSGENDDLKAFEAGVNFLAGFEFRGGFLITANYNAGLNNLANNNPQDPVQSKLYNRYFGIRFGYMFQGKRK